MDNKALFEKQVGNRARKLRESLGKTQEQIAEKADVSVSTIYNFENGIKASTLQTFNAICQALDTTPSYLLQGAVDKDKQLRDAIKKIEEIHQMLLEMRESIDYDDTKINNC